MTMIPYIPNCRFQLIEISSGTVNFDSASDDPELDGNISDDNYPLDDSSSRRLPNQHQNFKPPISIQFSDSHSTEPSDVEQFYEEGWTVAHSKAIRKKIKNFMKDSQPHKVSSNCENQFLVNRSIREVTPESEPCCEYLKRMPNPIKASKNPSRPRAIFPSNKNTPA